MCNEQLMRVRIKHLTSYLGYKGPASTLTGGRSGDSYHPGVKYTSGSKKIENVSLTSLGQVFTII